MNSFNALHKPSLFILMLALLAGNLFPAGAGNVTCGTPLNVTGALYTMNNSSSISGATCFNVSAANVTIDCKGFSVAGNNSTGTYGFYTSQVNTTVRNCNVSNFFYGIYFYGATDGLIQNVTASGSYTTGYVVYVSSGATASLGSHRTMINGLVSASLSNTYAMYIRNSLNVTANNVNAKTGGAGRPCEFDTSHGSLFANSTCNTTGNQAGAFLDSSNLTIINLTGISNTGYGIHLNTARNNNTIINSTGISNSSVGLYLQTPNSASIGSIGNSTSGNGITVAADNVSVDCAGSQLAGRNASSSYGIFSGQANTTVKNCIISNFDAGIYFNPGMNGTIQNITITSCTNYGIRLANSNYNRINGTSAASNAFYGISLQSSLYNIISNSTGASNASYGIGLSVGANYNTIANSAGNSSASYGIGLTMSYGNAFTNVNATSANGDDIYFQAGSISDCNNTLSGVTGTSGKPVLYFSNAPAIVGNNDTSAIILCNASYSRITDTNATGSGIKAYFTENSTFTRVAATSKIYDGIYLKSAANITMNGCRAASTSGDGMLASSSDRMVVANSTFTTSASAGRAIYLDTTGNGQFCNNTLAGPASTLAIFNAPSGNNTLYWNNFTATTGSYYMLDINGSNFYNTTINGTPAGNMWANVLNQSVAVYGNATSPFPGLYYASRGPSYPYNNSTAAGKLSGNIVDWGPLTNATSGCQGSINSSYSLDANVTSAATCFTVTAPNVAVDCHGFSITGNNASSTYGIYSNQPNTTIRNCAISNFETAVFFSGASNGTITNVSMGTTRASGYGLYLFNNANNNSASNFTASSAAAFAVYIQGSSGNSLGGFNATSRGATSAGYAINIYDGSQYNRLSDFNATGIGWGVIHAQTNSPYNTLANFNATELSGGNTPYTIYINVDNISLANFTAASAGSSSMSAYGKNITISNGTFTKDAYHGGGSGLAILNSTMLGRCRITFADSIQLSGINATWIELDNISNSNISGIQAIAPGGNISMAITRSSYNNFSGMTLSSTSGAALSVSNQDSYGGPGNNVFTNINATSVSGNAISGDSMSNTSFLGGSATSASNYTVYFTGFSSNNTIANFTMSSATNYSFSTDRCSTRLLENTFVGDRWVYDDCGYYYGGSNAYNDSVRGNKYYLANGSGAWTAFDIKDANGDGWADGGAARPFNSTSAAPYWAGVGGDWHPYTLVAGYDMRLDSVAVTPGAPSLMDDLGCAVRATNNRDPTTNVSFEWYRNGENQTSLAGKAVVPSNALATVSTLPYTLLSEGDAWGCRADADFGNSTESGWVSSNNVTATACGILSAPNRQLTLHADAHGTAGCLDVSNDNITIDCNGFSIIGDSETDSTGIYAHSSSGAAIRNCNVSGFDAGIMFDGETGGSIANSTIDAGNASDWGDYGAGIYISSSDGNSVANTTIIGDNAEGIRIADSNENNISSVNATSRSTFAVELESAQNNALANVSATSTGSTAMYIGNNAQYNDVIDCAMSAPEGTALYSAVTSMQNTYLKNILMGQVWVSDSGSGNAYSQNYPATGNTYYFANGTGAWEEYDISSPEPGYAIAGADLPFNAAKLGALWQGNGADWHPYTENTHMALHLPTSIEYPNAAYALDGDQVLNGVYGLVISAQNITIDCNGYSITGDNSTDTIGIYTDGAGTVIRNCRIRGFDGGIQFYGATDGAIINSTVESDSNAWGNLGYAVGLVEGASGNALMNSSVSGNAVGVMVDGDNNSIIGVDANATGAAAIFITGNAHSTLVSGSRAATADSGEPAIRISGGNTAISGVNASATDGSAIYIEADGNVVADSAAISENGPAIYAGGNQNAITDSRATSQADALQIGGNQNSFARVNATGGGDGDAAIYIGGNGNMFTEINATDHVATCVMIDGGAANTFANSSMLSAASYAIAAGGNGNRFYNNTVISTAGGYNAIMVGSSGNVFLENSIMGDYWVDDESGGGNTYNDSSTGNRYYFANGTGAWKVFDISRADGAGWADRGTDRPFNATTVAPYWAGSGEDWHPYTENLPRTWELDRLEASEPVITHELHCDIIAAGIFSPTANVSYEWYKDGVNQTALAGIAEISNYVLTNISTVPPSDYGPDETWYCRANVQFGNSTESGWAKSNEVSTTVCGLDVAAGETLSLQRDVVSAGTSDVCINVVGDNAEIDCNGYFLEGANITDSIGVHTNYFNTTVRNCNIRNFDADILFEGATNGTISNITAMAEPDSWGDYVYKVGFVSGASGNALDNSTLAGNGWGIVVDGENNSIVGVDARSTTTNAIHITGNAYSTQIFGTNATTSSGEPALLIDGGNATVSGVNAESAMGSAIDIETDSNAVAGGTFRTESEYPAMRVGAGSNTITDVNATSQGDALQIGGNQNTFMRINATGSNGGDATIYIGGNSNVLSGINATNPATTCVMIDGGLSNMIANSSLLSWGSALSIGGNGNYIYNNSMTATMDGYSTAMIGGTGNVLLENSIRGSYWVDDESGGNENAYNDSSVGNRYYFANGTPSWALLDMRDMDGNGWADAGSAVPLGVATAPAYWPGNGEDAHPYVKVAAEGNGSDIATTLPDVTVAIGNSTDFAGRGAGENTSVEIYSNGSEIASFQYNFSAGTISFSQVSIDAGALGGRAYASISGINASNLVGGKTLWIYGPNPAYTSICVKDEDGAQAQQMSSGCTGADETRVACDGAQHGAYLCLQNGTVITVSGLAHSAAIQVGAAAPPSPGGSGGESSNGGGNTIGAGSGAASGSVAGIYQVPMAGGTFCPVSIARAMESASGSTNVTTVLGNIGGTGCRMVNFTFVDGIPDSFPSIGNMSFAPQYLAASGRDVTFVFPAFAPGESETLEYSAGIGVRLAALNDFTVRSMSASAAKAGNGTAPQGNGTAASGQNGTAPAGPQPNGTTVQPGQNGTGAISPPASGGDYVALAAAGAVAVLIVAAAAALLILRRKRRGL